ncbi:hypothetical protein SUGI_0036180 [Cryptomeria japonica]|nr:wall-associated receptor kinase-like 14 isoform X2 [Cryptomeria japonica]GLJ06315.1 hypothetical protein SUGI_0036180 [Cryptomeria japonica]
MITLNKVSYTVTSIEADSIIINPNQSSCDIKLQNFTIDGVRSYTISPSNIIQFSNCNNSRNCSLTCNIPNRGNDEQCKFGNTCCHFLENDTLWQPGEPNFTQLSQQQCTGFTSWVISSVVPTYHAENGLKLEWAFPGNCANFGCHANAKCFSAKNVKDGWRCACKDGYIGDGFVDGTGCRRDCTKDGNQSGDCEKDKTKIIILAAGLLAGSALVAASIVSIGLVIRKRRNKQQRRGRDGNQLASLLHSRSEEFSTELFTYKILDRATKGFADAQKCGQGACGTVYAGRLPDGRFVAVKCMHHNSSKEGAHQFLNEISLLSTIKHKNLVQLLGCCLEADDPILVYEFVPNGTLTEHLHCENGKGPLDWRTRCAIAADGAQALVHLHTNLPQPVYHRDVKSPNILLDLDFNCKVADFGLSRLAPFDFGTHISTAPQGTPGYVDPEYHQNFHLSDKSDVYSFGVVLIEIITAMKPIDFTRNKKEVNLAALAVAKITSGCLDDIVDPLLQIGSRPHVRALVHRVAELAFRCLAHDKDARPTMTEVAEELLAVKNQCTDIEYLPPAITSESPEKSALSPTSVQALWPSNSTALSDSL